MSFKCSWICIRGRAKGEILERLGFAETGEPDPERLAPFSCAELSSGWFLVFANSSDWATPERIAEASMGGEAIGCEMSEVVMYSSATACADGVQRWRLVHYLDEGKELEVVGAPPAELKAIRRRLAREQEADEAVDFMFDAPIELVAVLCGFRADRDGAAPPSAFEAIRPIQAQGGKQGVLGWLAALIGRRR